MVTIDKWGSVVLSDERLQEIEADYLLGGGDPPPPTTNTVCPNSTNSNCINDFKCNGSKNSTCSNTLCYHQDEIEP